MIEIALYCLGGLYFATGLFSIVFMLGVTVPAARESKKRARGIRIVWLALKLVAFIILYILFWPLWWVWQIAKAVGEDEDLKKTIMEAARNES